VAVKKIDIFRALDSFSAYATATFVNVAPLQLGEEVARVHGCFSSQSFWKAGSLRKEPVHPSDFWHGAIGRLIVQKAEQSPDLGDLALRSCCAALNQLSRTHGDGPSSC